MDSKPKPSAKALIPFLIFIGLYLFTGFYLTYTGHELGFYAVNSPIFVIIGIISAFILFKGSMNEKFDNLVKGCGDENIIIMCLIYILAGAFASVAAASGSIESTVNLGMSIIPSKYLVAGIFLMGAFISLSTGTSVGTIVTVGPLAVGLAEKSGISLALMIGSLVGGAMFGDNLSVISDTTIAATRTQHVEMRDKFRMNFKIALPAAIITFLILLFCVTPAKVVDTTNLSFTIIKVVPYILVLVLALFGLNVFTTLTIGILFSGAIGLVTKSFTLLKYTQKIYEGFNGMFEIFLLSLLTGGLAYLVTKAGGIEWIIQKAKKLLKGKKSAELGICVLISILDIAVANNTVAIIIAGPVAKKISKEYKVDPRRSASLLDTFSCVFQGLIPYGAQVLIAASLTKGLLSPFDIIPYFWYQFILAIFAIISIYIPYTTAKKEWDFELDKVKED